MKMNLITEKLRVHVRNNRSKAAPWLLILILCTVGWAQTSRFTYQGKLNDGGAAASGTYDMRFRLFDGVTGEVQIGETQNLAGVQALRGIFSVELDFGVTAFSGEDRFLEIAISPSGQADFTTLSPRQKLGSSPYAIKSLNSATADNALSLGGTAASQFVQTADPRMADARTPLPGSSDYIQNGTTAQPGINFSVGGTGSASVLNAMTQFNLGGNRVLSGNANGLFVGMFSGGPTTSTGNVFVGSGSGMRTTSGGSNSFFGQAAGRENLTGATNTFVGFASGINNTTGNNNVFLGSFAGNSDQATQVSNSIAIGNNASTSQSNSIAIGNGVSVSQSNTIALGTLGQKTLVAGGFRTGAPVGVSGDLPGRGYMETFFISSIFQGIYTPNVVFGSFTANPRNAVQACVHFQGIPGQTAGVVLTNCTSALSSVKDKTDVQPFTGGLNIINRLKPVSFRHKENSKPGIGLNTEDVAEIDPSPIRRDEKLSREEIDETGLSVLLINAVKQQQDQIRRQQKQIDGLKRLICRARTEESVCRENDR